MEPEEPQIESIEDIIYRCEEYISFMRFLADDRAVDYATMLEEYVVLYFDGTKIDRALFKQEAVELLNDLYRILATLDMRDEYTGLYADIVLGSFFYKIQELDLCFIVLLSETLEDDLYVELKKLFEYMLFDVVTPYLRDIDEETAQPGEFSHLEIKEYEKVSNDIEYFMLEKNNIIYIEKDSSVNYISRIIDDTVSNDTRYHCLYRNKPVTTKSALWIHGKSKKAL